ncbi:hypothetical protein GS4_39_00530 [Gordonia soli NBRC 108243]|uniref:Uncharacterized protein n=1 Tax=Gordonia soli NBRC 108243 TaxID=1223545 RepID=M0QS28_9ACTN|nr:hypothetical protein GS4_39_00530 [Gordonia soli NBRC 108243]
MVGGVVDEPRTQLSQRFAMYEVIPTAGMWDSFGYDESPDRGGRVTRDGVGYSGQSR